MIVYQNSRKRKEMTNCMGDKIYMQKTVLVNLRQDWLPKLIVATSYI